MGKAKPKSKTIIVVLGLIILLIISVYKLRVSEVSHFEEPWKYSPFYNSYGYNAYCYFTENLEYVVYTDKSKSCILKTNTGEVVKLSKKPYSINNPDYNEYPLIKREEIQFSWDLKKYNIWNVSNDGSLLVMDYCGMNLGVYKLESVYIYMVLYYARIAIIIFLIVLIFYHTIYKYFRIETEEEELKSQKTKENKTVVKRKERKSKSTPEYITIGKTTWMTKNFDSTKNIPFGSIYNYNGNKSLIKKYGCLYDWYAAKYGAPKGWVLPSKDDYYELMQSLNVPDDKIYNELLPGGNSGFNLQLGGSYEKLNGTNQIGSKAFYWTSTNRIGDNDYHNFFTGLDKFVSKDEYGSHHLSVRYRKQYAAIVLGISGAPSDNDIDEMQTAGKLGQCDNLIALPVNLGSHTNMEIQYTGIRYKEAYAEMVENILKETGINTISKFDIYPDKYKSQSGKTYITIII